VLVFHFDPVQYDTVADMPKEYFKENKVIFGMVERVIDGDTIQVRHCPTRFGCPAPDQIRKRIYDSTLSVRIYGFNCPELQKRTSYSPSQSFAEEAKDYTSNLVLGKTVQIKLFRKDQYGRALGKVQTGLQLFPPFSRRDVSVELTQRGLATLYTGGGAEYDGNRELLQSKQEEAKRKKNGEYGPKGIAWCCQKLANANRRH
jgi:endonuclease YncB( thermonuclease family)